MASDPITLAVIEARLNSATVEMGLVMVKTARSPIFSQAHDFSCFIADADGSVLSQADGIPIHTGSGGFAVRGVLAFWGDQVRPGDLFLLNDPYTSGGNHLPDWTVINPVFVEGTLLGFTANRAHQADIGGGAIGTYNPDATEIFHEGVRLPPLRLYEGGALRPDVMQLLRLNCRLPEIMESDLQAMIGSTRVGARRLRELADAYGTPVLKSHFRQLLDASEEAMRREVARIPDGVYSASEAMNNDGRSRREVVVRVSVTVSGSDLVVDFEGTDAQVESFKNSSWSNTHSAVYMAIATLVSPQIPHNEGTYRCIKVIAPSGTVVNPNPPAPVTYATVFPAHEIIHAVWKALGPAMTGTATAGWGKTAFPISGSVPAADDGFVFYHWNGLSAGGAVEGWDGFEQIGPVVTLGGLSIPNMEVYESLYPVRFVRNELRCDGGGPGRWRGGCGVDYELVFEKPTEIVWRAEGFHTASGFGLLGGGDGRLADGSLDPSPVSGELPQYGRWRLDGGCTMRLSSSGGGGWGNPRLRDAGAVRADVIDGLVSIEAAARDYGVLMDSETLAINTDATAARRGS